ncbi:PREDICTED: cytochrome c oxidase subunit NDUFA4 [Chaetura pelagica]|uniref:cytochrome c oxidase subunit NDUFA4 n=1 Tax=Chaetura pelagica TaxID=8897 RepID=UPI000523B17E|nr:PREDICTED: cytochrome c oxidase subunit NDUFA4 [Chaetura pelagica]
MTAIEEQVRDRRHEPGDVQSELPREARLASPRLAEARARSHSPGPPQPSQQSRRHGGQAPLAAAGPVWAQAARQHKRTGRRCERKAPRRGEDADPRLQPHELIPLFLIIGSGGIGAGLYLMRLAVFNPDVSWDKKNNPEPWNKLAPSDQYKFYSVNVDYSRLKKDRPDF